MRSLTITGCVTLLGALKGLRVDELDDYLGMRSCAKGVWIVQATKLPGVDDFRLAGNTGLSTDKLEFQGKYDMDMAKRKLDYPWHKGEWTLKSNTLNRWRLTGNTSLVKVYPMDGITTGYPSASSPIPQWILLKPLPARLLLALYKPDDRIML